MRWLKNILLIIAAAFVVYHSVYFRKLDAYKSSLSAKEFNAVSYAQTFWETRLIPNLGKAVDVSQLSEMLSHDAEKTFAEYSHALGIGNLRYFLVKGTGMVESVGDDDVTVVIQNGKEKRAIVLETEFIFGNAVRDATGLVNINDFKNTMDFNNVSAEINKIIREKVLPPFKDSVKTGRQVEFFGAIELNKEHGDLAAFEVIPVQISFK